jgi:hypothetical protein
LGYHVFLGGYQVDILLVLFGHQNCIEMVQNEALEGNATWQANIHKNLGTKKEKFNDKLYIEEGLSLESSL